MDKQQAAEVSPLAPKMTEGSKYDFPHGWDIEEYRKDVAAFNAVYFAGWEAHEAQQSPTDAVAESAALIEALDKIANNTAYPCNEEQAFIWTDVARGIAQDAIKLFNPSGAAPLPEGFKELVEIRSASDMKKGSAARELLAVPQAAGPVKLPDEFYNCLPYGYEFVNEEPLISNNYCDDGVIEGQCTLSMQMKATHEDPFIRKHLTKIKELTKHYAEVAAAQPPAGPVWVKASKEILPSPDMAEVIIRYPYNGEINKCIGSRRMVLMLIEKGYTGIEYLDESDL